MRELLFQITLLGYLAASCSYLMHIASGRNRPAQIGSRLLRGSFVLLSLALVASLLPMATTPASRPYLPLSFLAWSVTGIFLWFEGRHRLTVLGAFLAPLSLLLLVFSGALLRRGDGLQPLFESSWFPLHVGLVVLGYAFFALAFIAGVMYLLQERMLKNKHLSALFFRLPSLDSLDLVNHRCLAWGFPLMTLGIITGAAWTHAAWGRYWRWNPKETWALISWLVYAVLLHGRLAIGWRGRRAALLAILGFLCLILAVLGVNLLASELSDTALRAAVKR